MICLSGCEKDYESGIGAMNISPFMLLLADISDSKDKLVVFRIYPSECRFQIYVLRNNKSHQKRMTLYLKLDHALQGFINDKYAPKHTQEAKLKRWLNNISYGNILISGGFHVLTIAGGIYVPFNTIYFAENIYQVVISIFWIIVSIVTVLNSLRFWNELKQLDSE